MKLALPRKGLAMPFDRTLLPDAVTYFENKGLTLQGPRSAKWKTTICNFHGGSDSMRVNVSTGAWVCMSCGEKGGDVLAYEIKGGGCEFVDAAKALGCWIDDNKPSKPQKPTPLPARAALEVLQHEAMLTAVAATNVSRGIKLSEADRIRLLQAACRINRIVEVFHG